MNAYDSSYVAGAQETLAEAFDYAEHTLGIGMQRFFDLFVATGVAEAFGSGSPRYVAGRSGSELVLDVCLRAGMNVEASPRDGRAPLDRSRAYWCGWALAYTQWRTGRSFRQIADALSLKEIESLYPVLHETSEEKVAEVLGARMSQKKLPARLKTIRKARGLSQKELARASDVSLRAIQQYEQRRKDIDKAQAGTLLRIARVLGCQIEDLLEG